MEHDLESRLASFVAGVRIGDLPPDVVRAAQLSILDTIAVALPSRHLPGVAQLGAIVREWGGQGEALGWTTGVALPAPWAALVNGCSSRALDFDDVHEGIEDHPSGHVVPAAIALAGGAGVTGADLVLGVAVGLEVFVRLAESARRPPSQTGRQLTKVFGATAASCRVLRLEESETHHALGAALGLIGGEMQSFDEGALMIRVNQGMVGAHGVMAARFAQGGITGPREFLTGRRGYFVAHDPTADANHIVAELGGEWRMLGIARKPYAGSRYHHSAIEATRRCVGRYSPADVEGVLVEVTSKAHDAAAEPREVRRRPRSLVDAQFSLPYAVAASLFTSETMADHFGDDVEPPTEVLDFIDRVETRGASDLDAICDRAIGPARVTLRLRDGSVVVETIVDPLGGPARPLDEAAIVRKVHECGELAKADPAAVRDLLLAVEALPQSPTCENLLRAVERLFASPG